MSSSKSLLDKTLDLTFPITIFGVGAISSTLGFLYGLGVRPNLISRIDDYIHTKIEDEINNFIESVEKDPEIIERFIKLLRPYAEKELGRVISKMTGGNGEEMKDLKIGGVKIPAWAVQMGLGFIQRGAKKTGQNVMENIIDINP